MKVNGYTIHPLALGAHGPLAQITQHEANPQHDRMLIADLATTDDGVHTPSTSMQIFGKPALLSLRDKLVELYPLPAPDIAAPLTAQRDEMLEALKSAKWMLERDYIDDQKMAVIRKCEEAIDKATGQEGGAL